MTTIQSRRRLIVILLLALALGGALLRQLSAAGSTARDIGTLMMLLWLPIIGNVIAWLVGQLRRRPSRAPSPFDQRGSFAPQLLVELTLRPPSIPAEDLPLPAGEHRCALVVGQEAFSMRWQQPAGVLFRRGTTQAVAVEFAAPQRALPLLPPSAAFRLLVGEAFVADGRVIGPVAPA